MKALSEKLDLPPYKAIGNEVGISGERVRQLIVYSLYTLRQNHNLAQFKALPESEFLRLCEENRPLAQRLDELIRQIDHPPINSEGETGKIKKQAKISLDSPVSYLDIPIHYAQRLNVNKIYTVGELINCTEFTLGRFRGVGKVFLSKIKTRECVTNLITGFAKRFLKSDLIYQKLYMSI